MTARATGPVAFVLDVNTFGGLGAVRSLAREGIPVIGLGVDPGRFGFATRFGRILQCPNPVTAPEELLGFLLEQGRRLDEPGVLLPASDEFVLFLWRYRDELQPVFRLNFSSPEVMEAGFNKRKQYELARRLGVPCPMTFYPATMAEVREIAGDLEYPAFIKATVSHLWRARLPQHGKGIKVNSPAELIAAYEEVLPAGVEPLVQSVVPGPNGRHFNVRACIGESGKILGSFVSQKVRQYPVEFGVGTLARSIVDPELLELGLRFFENSGFRGFGYIEFKRDVRDNAPYMIELNARFSAQIIHSTDCGINFPLLQYLDLAGRSPGPVTSYATGVHWLSSVSDFRSALQQMRSGQLSPWSCVASWAKARSFAVWAADDVKPLAIYLATLPSKRHRRPIACIEKPAARPMPGAVPPA